MPQNHKSGSGHEKMRALLRSLWWVSPRHRHSWQFFVQLAGEDGWCWKFPYSLDNLHQGFTIGKFFQASELKPSCCSPTTIFSFNFTMERKSRIVSSSLKVHFMFLKTILLFLLNILALGLKRPGFLSLSLQDAVSRPAAIPIAVLWLCSVGLSLTCLWLVDMLSTFSVPRLGPRDAERTLH